jgi:hypothetical protein
MTDTLQLEEAIQLHDAPKLLIEWSPRWEEFVTSIRPAFGRSGSRLAGEAPHGISPYWGMITALLLEAFCVFVIIVLPKEIDRLRPYAPPRLQPDRVIYYSGDELPHTEDLAGAQAGATGRSGGQEAHHRTQTIHVARGASLAPKIVDAPDLKLPSSSSAVANLLAFKSIPGPPPAEGLHSSLTAPRLPANVIAPAPRDVARDHSRTGLTLDSVVPPAPTISSDRSRTAPALNAAVVPPAPSVRSEHTLFAPALDPSIIAPAPHVSRERSRATPSLDVSVIGPASTHVARDQERSTPALNTSVIPPAPAVAGREVSPTRVQMRDASVVPPPVSAPEREALRNSKLSLPAPSVVAPPPSADSAHDLRRLESGNSDPSRAVVPPPPTQASGSFMSSVIGKIFGTQDVVPPPPTVSSSNTSTTARNAPASNGRSLATNVVPPPPNVASGSTSGTGRTRAGTTNGSLAANVVPPPPSLGGSTSASGRDSGSSLGASSVIPPPPSVGGSGTSRGSSTGSLRGSDNGALATGNVVPPPPSIASSGLSGSGRKGTGLGGPGDTGSALAPPKTEAGSSSGSGVVISSQPGSQVGLPGTGGKGSLAMSPSGGDKPGLGGSGAGASIGHGAGPGSGLSGAGSGAGKTGTSVGSDPNARGGISPTPGPGGAGSAPAGAPAVPGVDVRGGSTIVTLPSFGSDASSAPNPPGRSPVMPKEGPAITIVATSRSGGAFDFYGKLPGDNYTVYVDTSIGTVVMQFAEVNPAAHSQAGAIVGPQGLRTDLPADLPHARIVVKCRLDASGNLKDLQVVEPGPAEMTAKIMAALPGWKFRPAMRGGQPVEVNAILGFNINTNDRN